MAQKKTVKKLLKKAEKLEASEVSETQYQQQLRKLKHYTQLKRVQILKSMRTNIPQNALDGDPSKLSMVVRLLNYFNYPYNIRKFLHFFAQAESEKGSQPTVKSTSELKRILKKNAKAFEIANKIDQSLKS